MILKWLLECWSHRLQHRGIENSNLLATIDFDLEFTYALACWEGSSHDADILSYNMAWPDGFKIPDGNFYLGGVVYACWHGVLLAFKKNRCHLNDFSGRNYPNTDAKLFNRKHSRLRVFIEREFSAFKNRFKILDQKKKRSRGGGRTSPLNTTDKPSPMSHMTINLVLPFVTS